MSNGIGWKKPMGQPTTQLHPDLRTNLSTAELFIKNISHSLKKGMSVRVQGEECLMIAFRPPTEWPQGVSAIPIAFNQDKAEFGRLMEAAINRTMEIAERCFQDFRKRQQSLQAKEQALQQPLAG